MMALICVEVKSRHSFCPDASTGLTCQVAHALICVHQTLRAGSQRDCQLKPLPLPLPSVCLYSEQSSSLGLCDTAATWGPVVTPQTQEIPLLLLRSSVVAARLCVHFCGTDPVCMCQSRTGLFRKGGGGVQQTNPPQPQGTHTRKVKTNTTAALFSGHFQTLLLADPSRSPFFSFVLLPPPLCFSL